MDTVRRPLCGCFVLSCMVGGIVENPRAFGRCLPPARPEKALPFQAGRSPCTKRPQTVRLCLYAPKKVFEGSKGRFFKNAPLAGGWDRVPQREGEPAQRGTPFRERQGSTEKGRKRSSREKENELTVEQLYEALEERFPRSLSCMWDHDGKMVLPEGRREVKKVLCCLDCTDGAIEMAKAE